MLDVRLVPVKSLKIGLWEVMSPTVSKDMMAAGWWMPDWIVHMSGILEIEVVFLWVPGACRDFFGRLGTEE